MAELLHADFAANDFIGRRTPDQRFAGKLLATAGTMAGLLGVVLGNPFDKAFNQRAFATFMILKNGSVTFGAADINGTGGEFFVGFCHSHIRAAKPVWRGFTLNCLKIHKKEQLT